MIEVLKQLVEALREDRAWLELDAPKKMWDKNNEAITIGRQAIADLEKQKPVAWARFSEKGNLFDLLSESEDGYTPLYTSPQPRKPLTKIEIGEVLHKAGITKYIHEYGPMELKIIRAIEQAYGIKE
jgi:hypothetical protein